MGLRIVVTGGRDYADRAAVYAALDRLHRELGVALVAHGACRVTAEPNGTTSGRMSGADRWACEWAHDRGVIAGGYPVTREEYDAHGRAAPCVRNRRMLDTVRPDGVVAFPGGRGTADCCRAAEERGLKVWRP